jgi:16S rRNA G1207 methylase RsmC
MIKMVDTGKEISPKNCVLVADQRPNCTVLGGSNQWALQGRIIRKGEKAIRIFGVHETDEGKKFPRVPVFDISQTEEVAPEKREEWIGRAMLKRAAHGEKKKYAKQNAKQAQGEISERVLETAKIRLRDAESEMSIERRTNTARRARLEIARLQTLEKIATAARLIIAASKDRQLAEMIGDTSSFEAVYKMVCSFVPEKLVSHPEWALIQRGLSQKRQIIEAKQNALGAGVDLFPTGQRLAKMLVSLAKIGNLCEVLEPSCGTGNLLKAIIATGAEVHGVEISERAAAVAKLAAPQATIDIADFLSWEGGNHFDAVIMNPPFSADIEHIIKAWQHLAPGGRLVSLCAASRCKKRAAMFDSWVSESGATVEAVACQLDDFENTNLARVVCVHAVK